MFAQVGVIMLQNWLGPTFFLPRTVSAWFTTRTNLLMSYSSIHLKPRTTTTHTSLFQMMKHRSHLWAIAQFAWTPFSSSRAHSLGVDQCLSDQLPVQSPAGEAAAQKNASGRRKGSGVSVDFWIGLKLWPDDILILWASAGLE